MRTSSFNHILRERREETKRCIQKASGGLIWAGKEGILIIAPNRSFHEDRIHQLHDRIACLMRGALTSVAQLWIPAVGLVCHTTFQLSAGDVHAKDIAKQASNTLIKYRFDFNFEQLKAEMSIAQINPFGSSQDYLGHIDFEGDIEEFERVRFFDVADDDDKSRINTEKVENWLQEIHSNDTPFKELIDKFENYKDCPEDSSQYHVGKVLFGDMDAKRVEIVILNREMAEKREYRKVFKRL